MTLPRRNPGSCLCSSINHPSWEDGDRGSDWSTLPILASDWLWQWQCCGIESFYSWECHHLISTVAKEHLNSLPMRGQSYQISANQRAPVTLIRVRGLNTSSSWLWRQKRQNKSRHSFFPNHYSGTHPPMKSDMTPCDMFQISYDVTPDTQCVQWNWESIIQYSWFKDCASY